MIETFKGALVILLADDDEDNHILIHEALGESGLRNELYCVPDGIELMDYLFQRGEYSDPAVSPRPDFILLDLNMPRKDGREALREIKSDGALKNIPVVILTVSSENSDKLLTQQLGARSFFTKPSSFQELVDLFQRNAMEWLERF